MSDTENETITQGEAALTSDGGSEFLLSLDELTADDISPKPPKEKKSLSELLRGSVRTIIALICLGVFVWSLYEIVTSLYNYKRGDDIYAGIAGDFHGAGISAKKDSSVKAEHLAASPKNAATPDFATSLTLSPDYSFAGEELEVREYNEEYEQVKAQLHYLAEKYPDLYGWITIPDTNIDYPIVQYTDNDYYLEHAANGDYLPAGSIFTDYRCYKNILKNHNTIFYGHNMMNGLMFNNVTNYLDEEFFNSHPYITVSTPDGIFTYLVFAIYQTDMYYSYITTDFLTHEDFVAFAYEMEANSLYHRDGIEFTETDRIITLSTCTNGYYTNRYALQALLVGISN